MKMSLSFSLPLAMLALASCAVPPVAEMRGDGQWILVELLEPSISLADVAPTMRLQFAENTVSGHAGCNRYSGAIEPGSGDELRFGPIAATKMACAEAGRMATESAFLSMLSQVRSQRRSADELVLLDGQGKILAHLLSGPAEVD